MEDDERVEADADGVGDVDQRVHHADADDVRGEAGARLPGAGGGRGGGRRRPAVDHRDVRLVPVVRGAGHRADRLVGRCVALGAEEAAGDDWRAGSPGRRAHLRGGPLGEGVGLGAAGGPGVGIDGEGLRVRGRRTPGILGDGVGLRAAGVGHHVALALALVEPVVIAQQVPGRPAQDGRGLAAPVALIGGDDDLVDEAQLVGGVVPLLALVVFRR